MTPALCDSGAPAASPRELAPAPRLLVVHAGADDWFVRGALLPALALAPQEVLATSQLGLGEMALQELERGIERAAVTVVLLSHAFVADVWSGLAGVLASHAEREGHGQVVPLVLHDVASPLRRVSKRSLDLRERAQWPRGFSRLRALLGAPEELPREDLPCPYPGRRPYGAAEARRFFGREREITELVQRLRAGAREIVVTGPSCSGKSSLVSAGVLPRLARGVFGMPPMIVRTMRPGIAPALHLAQALGHPLEDPAATLTSLLAEHEPGARALVFIDQLEELFTSSGGAERARFLSAVRSLRQDERCTLLWGLRADLLGEHEKSELWPRDSSAGPAAARWLGEPQVSQLPVAPLRGELLRAAILRPAIDAGVVLEPGLLERLLADAVEEGEPGALPHLQEALVRLWEKRQGRVLPLTEYQARSQGRPRAATVAVAR